MKAEGSSQERAPRSIDAILLRIDNVDFLDGYEQATRADLAALFAELTRALSWQDREPKPFERDAVTAAIGALQDVSAGSFVRCEIACEQLVEQISR